MSVLHWVCSAWWCLSKLKRPNVGAKKSTIARILVEHANRPYNPANIWHPKGKYSLFVDKPLAWLNIELKKLQNKERIKSEIRLLSLSCMFLRVPVITFVGVSVIAMNRKMNCTKSWYSHPSINAEVVAAEKPRKAKFALCKSYYSKKNCQKNLHNAEILYYKTV